MIKLIALITLSTMFVSCSSKPSPPPPVQRADSTASDRLLAHMNHARTSRGKSALTTEPRLTRAAYKHAAWMAKHKRFQHLGAGGRDFQKRLSAEGYPRCYSAENLALTNSASSAVDMWLKSKGHRRNLLNSKYTRVGIGVVGRYWVANYAQDRGQGSSADLPPPSAGSFFQGY